MSRGPGLLAIVCAALVISTLGTVGTESQGQGTAPHWAQRVPTLEVGERQSPKGEPDPSGVATPGSPQQTNLSFLETGLPANTSWEVFTSRPGSLFSSDNLTTRAEINESLPDGVYDLSAAADRPDYATYGVGDSIDLTGGRTTVVLAFYLGYQLTFEAEGLPFNESWNVSVTALGIAQNRTIAGNSTEFWIPAGGYSYVDSASGFRPLLGSGSGRLSANTSVALDFSRPQPSVGTLNIVLNVGSADVYLNGAVTTGVRAGSTSFNLTVGLWTVYVRAVGYQDYFNVTKIEGNRTVTMVVNLQPTPANPGPPLLSATADLIVIGLVAGIAVVSLLFVVAWRRLARP